MLPGGGQSALLHVERPTLIVVGDHEFVERVQTSHQLHGRPVFALAVAELDAAIANDVDLLIEGDTWAEIPLDTRSAITATESATVVATDVNQLQHPLRPAQRCAKRAFDLLCSAVLLAAVLLPLAFLLVAVRLTSRGPAIFRQPRVGENGRHFSVLKLRTMYIDADDAAHRAYTAALIRGEASHASGMYKLVGDPRITPLGRWLRRLSLDELPQLWNVIRGDMSLVGPRPALPNEVAHYEPRAWERLRVKPGLTGLWQVSGRCALNFNEMIELDVRYAQEWSLLSDLRIALRTPVVMATGRGAA